MRCDEVLGCRIIESVTSHLCDRVLLYFKDIWFHFVLVLLHILYFSPSLPLSFLICSSSDLANVYSWIAFDSIMQSFIEYSLASSISRHSSQFEYEVGHF